MRYLTKNYKPSFSTIKKYNGAIISILFIMCIGSIIGSIFIAYTNFFDTNNLYNFIDFYVSSKNRYNSITNFEIFFKNIRFFILIWFLGFLPYGKFFTIALILLKGIFLGITSSLFMHIYGNLSIKYIFELYFFENAIIVLLIIYTTINSINYSYEHSSVFFKYLKVLIISILTVYFTSIF